MAKHSAEPQWLSRLVVDAIHTEQLREHGGLPGIRDETALKSALARPQQKWHYSEKTDMALSAAAYGFGLVKNHPYRDGNKRIGFLAIVTFLGINGHELEATDADVVSEMLALADGHVSEEELADWIRQHGAKRNLLLRSLFRLGAGRRDVARLWSQKPQTRRPYGLALTREPR